MELIDTFFNWGILVRSFPILIRGLGNTILLGCAAIAFGTIAGLAMCLMRLYGPKPLQRLAVLYIDIFRALPILVVLILIYYALPFVGIRLSSFVSAALALSLVLAAFTAEVCRAGIENIPKGQFEAAAALGLPFWVAMRKVVLPQAIRVVIPPLTSNCVSVFKDTALASVVAMPDLLKQATDAQANDGQSHAADRRRNHLPRLPVAAGASGRLPRSARQGPLRTLIPLERHE